MPQEAGHLEFRLVIRNKWDPLWKLPTLNHDWGFLTYPAAVDLGIELRIVLRHPVAMDEYVPFPDLDNGWSFATDSEGHPLLDLETVGTPPNFFVN
jgi:hypothetical protein